jgi:hypothetical protein
MAIRASPETKKDIAQYLNGFTSSYIDMTLDDELERMWKEASWPVLRVTMAITWTEENYENLH